jgi:RNA polymerase-binding transcription factor DksA
MNINRDVDRTADLTDHAQDVSELFLEASLSQVPDPNVPETHPDFDGENCVSCGDPIPKARLALGKVRDVKCQQAVEAKAKLFSNGR